MCDIIGREIAGCEHDYAKVPPPAAIPPPPKDDEVDDISFSLQQTQLDEFNWSLAHVVFYEKLEELIKLKKCSLCGEHMSGTPREVGSALVLSYRCICGGSDRWESQSRVGGKFVGNALTVTSTFMRQVSSC